MLISEVCTASERQAFASNSVDVSGYLETYYIHDFNRSGKHKRSFFTYSHDNTEDPSINWFFLKASYSDQSLRSNLALASGTYMRANYSVEPEG